jgi:putative cardiolipin synthase
MPRTSGFIQRACTLLAFLLLGACGGLPKGGGFPHSTAIKDENGRLADYVRPRVAGHPGKSGLHALPDARDALAARLALADAAETSLDVQYFIWSKDSVGRALIERMLRAADRGVRVRLLLDDLGTVPSDEVLLALDSHPNVEVRMFNPVALRSMRMLGILGEIGRINRRMHNKSFTVDGEVAVVGGRNIADEYFGASAHANFADLDVVLIGPAVKEVSKEFDLYWNHPTAVPIATFSRQQSTPEQIAAQRSALLTAGKNRGAFRLCRHRAQ